MLQITTTRLGQSELHIVKYLVYQNNKEIAYDENKYINYLNDKTKTYGYSVTESKGTFENNSDGLVCKSYVKELNTRTKEQQNFTFMKTSESLLETNPKITYFELIKSYEELFKQFTVNTQIGDKTCFELIFPKKDNYVTISSFEFSSEYVYYYYIFKRTEFKYKYQIGDYITLS